MLPPVGYHIILDLWIDGLEQLALQLPIPRSEPLNLVDFLALFSHHQEINDVLADELAVDFQIKAHLRFVAYYLPGPREQVKLTAILRFNPARMLVP
jgi:hypothetical protein